MAYWLLAGAKRCSRYLVVACFYSLFYFVAFVGCQVDPDDDSAGSDDDAEDDDAGDDDADVPRSVACGDYHTCALTSEGKIRCWGCEGPNEDPSVCSPPEGTYTAISSTYEITCALSIDGAVVCWGNDYFGLLDVPDDHLASISVGGRHACGISSSRFGTPVCWGCGNPTYAGACELPQGPYSEICAGSNHTCAIDDDSGQITCSGCEEDEVYGVCDAPVASFTTLAAGDAHTCAIISDHTVDCWGCEGIDEDFAAICDDPTGTFESLSAEGIHTCGVRTDGSLHCWGYPFGGDELDYPMGEFISVSAGVAHNCAMNNSGEIVCWGCGFEFDSGQCDVPEGQEWLSSLF